MKMDEHHWLQLAEESYLTVFPVNFRELERAQLPSVIATMRQAQTRWAGHVFWMSDSRIPKQLLYGEFSQGARKVGGQRKRFKDSLKAYLKDFNIDITTLENAASDRLAWRSMSPDMVIFVIELTNNNNKCFALNATSCHFSCSSNEWRMSFLGWLL